MVKVRFRREFSIDTYYKKLFCDLTIEVYVDSKDEHNSPILPAELKDAHTEIGDHPLTAYWATADKEKGCRYATEKLWVFAREGWDKLIEAVYKRELQIEEKLREVIEENRKLLDSMPQAQEREVVIED